jgi:glycosyltransferase EpsE
MEDKEKVSVIMSVYNCAETLPQAIESIIAQTYENWELILCDDASTDKTREIASRYASMYSEKIILVQNEKNMKLSYSLNRCLERCSGKYVARMDADDKCEPNRLEKQVAFLESHKEYALVGTSMRIFDGKQYQGVREYKACPDKYDMLFNPCFAHATIMTYKKVYEDLGGYAVCKRTERGQDYDLWFRFFAKGYRGYNLSEPLYIVTEDEACYKRKKFKYRLYSCITALKGYRLVGIKKRYYIFAFKSLVAGVIPSKVLKKMHKRNK